MTVYVKADGVTVVPFGDPEAAFGLTEKDAKRRGIVPLGEGESFAQPEVLRSGVEPEAVATVNEAAELATVEADLPEAKEAPKPADKARRKPRTK